MERWRTHLPTSTSLAAMLAIALLLGSWAGNPASAHARGGVVPHEAIPLPGPGEDRDLDSYADAVDLTVGNRIVHVNLTKLDIGHGMPYILVGTQDDHMRTGAGRELEWRHVVDHDPLGRKAGSPTWARDALRTGQWVTTQPAASEDHAIAAGPNLEGPGPSGVHWPQSLVLDVREDRATVNVTIEAWDAEPRPHRLVERWHLAATLNASYGEADGPAVPLGSSLVLTGGAELVVTLQFGLELGRDAQAELISKWAPLLRFDSGEAFFPVPGEALAQFHGIYRGAANLETWNLDFNNGRDQYRLLLADFDGDRRVDHRDATVLTDVLAASPIATTTIYGRATLAHGGAVVVQYWFLYFYNFVAGEDDRDILALAHSGDREFVQLTFKDLESARTGLPTSISYGHHYGGIRVTDLHSGEGPLAGPAGRPVVFIAKGSHANYPVAGDDRAVRPAFSGFFDRFDGAGKALAPGNYSLQLLDAQPWHVGHLWGPVTRYSRDLGTSSRPLLQHDFRYPWHDSLAWERGLDAVDPDEAIALYGGAA